MDYIISDLKEISERLESERAGQKSDSRISMYGIAGSLSAAALGCVLEYFGASSYLRDLGLITSAGLGFGWLLDYGHNFEEIEHLEGRLQGSDII